MTPPPSRPKRDSGDSYMSISQLATPKKDSSSKFEASEEKITKLHNSIDYLMGKADSYYKNTGITYSDIKTPESKKKQYKHSPFGSKLGISDYSNFL